MENFTWDAVPSQRQRKTEKYTYAVMTMSALAKAGAGRKFSFNKAAQELMTIEGEDRISFGFNADRTVVAVRKAHGDTGFKLTKTCTFSDKKTFEFISKTLELSNEIENEFKILETAGYYTLELIDSTISNDEVEADAEMQEMETEEVIEEKTAEDEVAEVEVLPSEDVENQW